jgi:hypothetical protein
MGKRTKWKDDALQWTPEGEFDRELTELSRNSDEQTQYEAPRDRKWKARNVVTVHWNILNYPCPYPSMVHIFACVIDHANINTGRCDASQKVMAIETGYCVKTVRKVLDWIAANTPFLEIERRTGSKGQFRSNAYHVQWQHLEVDWIGIQVCIDEAKQEHRDANRYSRQDSTVGTQGGTRKGNSRVPMDRGNSRGDTNHELYNHEEEPRPERVPSDEGTPVLVNQKENEEAFSKEEVESASTNSQPPETPSYGEAQQRVSGYCKPFHWDHLTQEEFDSAVAAEIEVVGAGRAVVDDAANKTWQEKRKGKDQ